TGQDTEFAVTALAHGSAGDANVNIAADAGAGWTLLHAQQDATAAPAGAVAVKVSTAKETVSHTWSHDASDTAGGMEAVTVTFRASAGTADCDGDEDIGCMEDGVAE